MTAPDWFGHCHVNESGFQIAIFRVRPKRLNTWRSAHRPKSEFALWLVNVTMRTGGLEGVIPISVA
jgi:hypothetical protein